MNSSFSICLNYKKITIFTCQTILFNKKITIIRVDEVDETSLGKRILEFINIFD
jgi:hypothetical protein